MKKVLFACDGKKFSKGAFEFLKKLHEKETVLATGLFFTSTDYGVLFGTAPHIPNPYDIIDFDTEEKLLKETIDIFADNCQRNGIEYRVHNEGDFWTMDDIQKETRFADMLLISEESFFSNISNKQPNAYMEDILHRTECSILLVPEEFNFPQKILIAYDGKEDSMFAMKQFCYLLPSFCDMETEIVYLKDEKEDKIPDLDYLEEYASRHFSDLRFTKLHFDARKGITIWLEGRENMLMVSGAYGRSGISTTFRSSFAKELIKEHKLPIFLAHH